MSPDAPGFDVAFNPTELQQRCLNSLPLTRRVVQAFLVSGAEYVADIERFAQARQWADVARAAHRLKGASENAAACGLAQKAIETEKSVRLQPESLAGPMAELWHEWERFRLQAADFLKLLEDPHATAGHAAIRESQG